MKFQDKMILIVIVVAFFIFSIIFISAHLLNVGDKFIKKEINYFEQKIQENKDIISCEIDYKGLHYKGLCLPDNVEKFGEFVEYTIQFELLQECMSNPYAYRFEPCRKLMYKEDE